ncbi:MAG: hypothetical protein WAW36_14545 [Methylovulum miyakonense]|uniref:hypothetical protein n=1 Tax=Methylovulum miyakonense TaxID=645578 RepID=UPI003BB5AB7F
MFKISFKVLGRTGHSKDGAMPTGAAASRRFATRRSGQGICSAALLILVALALPDGAKATAVAAYSAAQGVFYLADPNKGAAPPTPVKIIGAQSNWQPVLGAGSYEFGLYDPRTGTFHLRLEGSTGPLTRSVRFDGFKKGWLPVAGDWDGDLAYGVGLYDPQTGAFYLKNQLTSGPADMTARLGNTQATWRPLVGDWDGDGVTTIGAYNPGNGQFYLRNANTHGSAELTLGIQGLTTTGLPVAADWDGDGAWSPGLYNPARRSFYWRNALNSGPQQGSLKLTGVEAKAVPLARSLSVTRPTPAVTDAGAPSGSMTEATIGAGGGTLRSSNGRLLLTVPPGALAADTRISIRPITNHAHGGKGKAYRLLPDGQIFQKPVKLTFSYTGKDLNGTTAAALGGAFQTHEGYWHWVDKPVVNIAAKTVTIPTTHFTDFSFVEGFSLRPEEAKVLVNNRIDLALKYCYPYRGPDPNKPDPVGLGMDCDGAYSDLAPLVPVTEWAVNGVAGGNSELGTVKADADNLFTATYTAPVTKPIPATVDVTARLPMDGVTLLFSHITILDQVKTYKGTYYFDHYTDNPRHLDISAKANVTWTQFNDPDSADNSTAYLPSGNIVADITFEGCDPKRVNIPIHTGTANMPGGMLSVFSEKDPQFPKYYGFRLEGENIKIPLHCYYDYPYNEMPYTATYFGSGIGDGISGCQPGGELGVMPTYTDKSKLFGAEVCAGLSSDFWSFEGIAD